MGLYPGARNQLQIGASLHRIVKMNERKLSSFQHFGGPSMHFVVLRRRKYFALNPELVILIK
ncbi:hypothetical protein ASE07_04240 [Noviherbaspirillum sp. Root189]|nr:hypothetical protein ASE07_04240 [Noviherbaspirillum sp. Root189]